MRTLQKVLVIFVCLAVLSGGTALAPTTVFAAAPAKPADVPQVIVNSVVPDVSVTIQISGFKTETLRIMMSSTGNKQVRWTKVATQEINKGQTLSRTIGLPFVMKGANVVYVRVQGEYGKTAKTWYYNTSYNGVTWGGTGWPNNNTLGNTAIGGSIGGVVTGSGTNRPYVEVDSFVPNQSLSVTAYKLTAGVVFNVWVGSPRNVNYHLVGSFYKASGGSQSATFTLPVSLVDARQVTVALEDTRVPCSMVTLRSTCVTAYSSYLNKR